MAEKTKTQAAGKRGGTLDLPMAALAGGSVGFFAFAMPADLFERLIGAAGLPALLPAAQPPLGDTARLAFVGAAAFAAFAAVWLLLRALSPKPVAASRPFAEAASEPPRLRRADMHPDAPARHPLRAGVDFGVPLDPIEAGRGEPVDLAEVEGVDFEAEWERPTPSFLNGASDEVAADDDVAPAAEAEAVDVPFWLPDEAGDEPAPEVEPSEPRADDDAPVLIPFWAQQVDADAGEEPPQPAEPSLDQLATRLEGGLIRRKREGRSTRPRGHRGTGDRLRTALDDLTRMSKRS